VWIATAEPDDAVEHQRELGLPSPETVKAERAEFFAARYSEDRE
jgi:hypothetical protein